MFIFTINHYKHNHSPNPPPPPTLPWTSSQQQSLLSSIIQSFCTDYITGRLEKQILRWNIYYMGVFNTQQLKSSKRGKRISKLIISSEARPRRSQTRDTGWKAGFSGIGNSWRKPSSRKVCQRWAMCLQGESHMSHYPEKLQHAIYNLLFYKVFQNKDLHTLFQNPRNSLSFHCKVWGFWHGFLKVPPPGKWHSHGLTYLPEGWPCLLSLSSTYFLHAYHLHLNPVKMQISTQWTWKGPGILHF